MCRSCFCRAARRARARLVPLAVLASFQLAACADDELPAQPELPPVQSLQAELAAVESAPAAAKVSGAVAVGKHTHFANAWIRVKVVQLLGIGVVFVPAVAMGLALAEEPTFEAGSWIWEVEAAGHAAKLTVTGNPLSGWHAELRVTGGKLNDFLWVEGDFSDKTSGSWTLHDANLTGDDAALEINWTFASESDYSLEYVNVNTQSPDVGDTARFALSEGTATLDVTDASSPSVVAKISWDSATGAGSIEVPGYNTGQQACWGEDFINADCP